MGKFRAGAAKVDMTPPIGVELCGYGAFLGRRSTAVHDPLYCRALVLENVASNRVQTAGTGLVDPELTVIRIDDRHGQTMATIVHFSAHPVTLGPANTQTSGDYAGAACRLLEQHFGDGAVALFLNGA